MFVCCKHEEQYALGKRFCFRLSFKKVSSVFHKIHVNLNLCWWQWSHLQIWGKNCFCFINYSYFIISPYYWMAANYSAVKNSNITVQRKMQLHYH